MFVHGVGPTSQSPTLLRHRSKLGIRRRRLERLAKIELPLAFPSDESPSKGGGDGGSSLAGPEPGRALPAPQISQLVCPLTSRSSSLPLSVSLFLWYRRRNCLRSVPCLQISPIRFMDLHVYGRPSSDSVKIRKLFHLFLVFLGSILLNLTMLFKLYYPDNLDPLQAGFLRWPWSNLDPLQAGILRWPWSAATYMRFKCYAIFGCCDTKQSNRV